MSNCDQHQTEPNPDATNGSHWPQPPDKRVWPKCVGGSEIAEELPPGHANKAKDCPAQESKDDTVFEDIRDGGVPRATEDGCLAGCVVCHCAIHVALQAQQL